MTIRSTAKSWAWSLAALLFAAGLFIFYVRYVPLIAGYQFLLAPVLFLIFVSTVFHLETGVLFFVFFFPLINSLPYFFGIQGDIPHAPTAIVLFLFFFLAFLIRTALFSESWNFSHPVFKPMRLLALLILVSAFITFLRYGNFYPFSSGSFLELTTNTKGVSAGGAVMSVVFSSLNYLTGFAFFAVLVNMLKSPGFRRRLLIVFSFSAAAALAIGTFQVLINNRLGNNAYSIKQGLVNGTFKDSLSFGAFIVMIVPLMLGISLSHKGPLRLLSWLILVMALILIFFTGSKIGLISVALSLVLFAGVVLRSRRRAGEHWRFHQAKWPFVVAVILILIILAGVIFVEAEGHMQQVPTLSRLRYMMGEGVFDLLKRWRGPLWRGAVSMMQDYPLSGVGVGAYIIEVANYEQKFHKYETPQSAENYFLQAGAELGLFGLLLSILIFWKIGAAFKDALRNLSGKNGLQFLFIGMGIGLLAYFINLCFHTFIGSYEVKYTFWFLAALVVSRAVENKLPPAKKRREAVLFTAGFLAVLLAGGILVWHSVHSLSLESRTKQYHLVHDFGFYRKEITPEGQPFHWTGKTAGLSIQIEKPVLVLRMQASHPDIFQRSVLVEISYLDGSFKRRYGLARMELKNNDWVTKKIRFPNPVPAQVVLLIHVSRTWNPKKNLGIEDPRNLGIALEPIRQVSADSPRMRCP